MTIDAHQLVAAVHGRAARRIAETFLAVVRARNAVGEEDLDVIELDPLDVTLAFSVAAILLVCLCKRPRTTSAFILAWLVWFSWKWERGQADDVATHARAARKATEVAFRALWAMCVAWARLLLPCFIDAWHLVQPLFAQIWKGVVYIDHLLTLEQKAVLAIVILGVVGTVKALLALRRKVIALQHQAAEATNAVGETLARKKQIIREALPPILFQLSFVVVGPLIWWIMQQLPQAYAAWVAQFVMSFFPAIASLLCVLRLQKERRDAVKRCANESRNASWRDRVSAWFTMEKDAHQVDISESVQKEMDKWLAYWSCWPFFSTAHSIVHSSGLVDEKYFQKADAVLTVLVVWAMVWRASRLAPYLLTLFGSLFSNVVQKATSIMTQLSGRAISCALSARTSVMGAIGARGGMMIAVGIAGFIVVAVVLKVFAFFSALLVFLVFWVVAVDSARAVAKQDGELCAARLSFWVVAMAWLWLCTFPVFSSVLPMWTPLVYIAALVAGETVLDWMLQVFLSALTRLVDMLAQCCNSMAAHDSEGDHESAAGPQETSGKGTAEDGMAQPLLNGENGLQSPAVAHGEVARSAEPVAVN